MNHFKNSLKKVTKIYSGELNQSQMKNKIDNFADFLTKGEKPENATEKLQQNE
jgi:hypothetical protein